MSVRLAGGAVSWGVDFADAPGNPPWQRVLDGVRAAGLRGVELGPLGYLPEQPRLLRDELARRELELVAGFVFEPLHDRARLRDTLALGRRVAALVAALGGRALVLIDRPCAARAATAGDAARAPRLDADGRRALAAAIGALAAVAADAGLVAALHPHAGSYVEFADEIAAAAELAPLCLDTGHAAYAGLDAAALASEYGDRVALVHLKDVDAAVLARGLGFWDAVAAGVFCPAGRGVVDFAAVAQALARAGYRGWATVEQDRAPGGGDPVADLVAGRMTLEQHGFGGPR